MVQATKSPVVKSSTPVKSPVVTNIAAAENLGESLLHTWSEGLERFCAVQKELEDLFLQALEQQKDSWGKLNDDIARVEEEQRKLYEHFRESTKANLTSVFGPSAGKAVDQLYAQFDAASGQLQELTFKPYKEIVNLLSQSQDQFTQTIQNSIEQQQKIREEFKVQFKSTQQIYLDLYEKNTQLVFGLFR
jgi:hypothetical protein